MTLGTLKSTTALAAAALLCSQGAWAQSQAPSGGTPPTSRLANAGAAEQRDVTVSLITRYDSNVARVGDSFPNLTDLEREDVRVSPAVSLLVTKNLGRHQVGLRSYLGYDFYLRNDRLGRERLSVEPFAYLDLPVCDLAVEAGATRQQSELGDLVLLSLDPTIGIDNTETRKRVNGRIICGDQVGLRPTFEAEYATGTNDNFLRRTANYETTRIQTGVGYASPTLGEISIYALRQDTDLPNQLLPNGNGGGFTLTGYGVSYARNIGTRLKFNGAISNTEIRPYGGIAAPRSGINANAAVTLTASSRLWFTGFASRQFTNTLTANSTYEVGEDYGLTATYAANDRLRLRVGGRYSPREFVYAVTPVPAPAGLFITEQKQHDIFAGATYNLNRRMRLTLDGGYQRRTADLAQFDYDSVFAALGISISL